MTVSPKITHLTDTIRAEWDADSGKGNLGEFSNAVKVWAWAQNRDVTINDAALAFNVSPDLIREAVDYGYWTEIGPGDLIEFEGE